MKTFKWALILCLFLSVEARAGLCVLKVTREACPGKDIEAFRPYQGHKETEDKKELPDESACRLEAERAVKIVRKGTLIRKSIKVTFDKKTVLGDFSSQADCK